MRRLLNYITYLSTPISIVLLIASVAAWVPDFTGADQTGTWSYAWTLALVLANGLGLSWLFYSINLSRFFSLIPMLLYVGITACYPSLHGCWQAQVGILSFSPIIIMLHRAQYDQNCQRMIFYATLFLIASACFRPVIAIFVPVLLFAMIYLGLLTLRTWLAMMMAIAAGCIYYALAIRFLPIRTELLYGVPVLQYVSESLTLRDWIQSGVLLTLITAATGQILWRIGREGHDVRYATSLFVSIGIIGGITAYIPLAGQNITSILIYAFASIGSLLLIVKNLLFNN